MGIFGAKTSGAKAATPPRGAAVAGALSVIATGMTVRGDIESNGIVKVEGTVDGHVVAREQVLVARGGVVHGDIESRETVVGGMVHGAILATGRVEVQAGATVLGDITTKRIAVAEGATLNGQIRMGEHAAAAAPGTAMLEVKVSTAARAEARSATPSLPRASAPVARVAVPPRATTPGAGH